jgi:tetratricopeptide (TPR) repeat protein
MNGSGLFRFRGSGVPGSGVLGSGVLGSRVPRFSSAWSLEPSEPRNLRNPGTYLVLVLVALLSGCVENPPPATAPKYPDIPRLDVPAGLAVPADAARAMDAGWQRLQAGDSAGAKREFADILKRAPAFYPAEAGLGFVALVGHDYKEAAARFTAVTARNGRYLPALVGAADAAMGLGDDDRTVAALEAIVRIDPLREPARTRLEVLRVRRVQSQIDEGRRAREAGRLDEARTILERALGTTPDNPVVLRELALVDLAAGRLSSAESRARRSIQIDSGDADALAVLGEVLERAGKFRDAADAYTRAFAIDPRPAWRDKRTALQQKADEGAMPAEVRAIATAPRATRADVAAMIGLRLVAVIARSPRRVPAVATDVRGHWAAQWILPVTQAGIMEVFPNHTFQPAGTVRRSELAQIVSDLLTLAALDRPTDLARWKAARPRFSDLPATHASYAAAALSVASGAMAADTDRFVPDRPVSGPELVAAVGRLQQIASK